MMESNTQGAFQRLLQTGLNPSAWQLVSIKENRSHRRNCAQKEAKMKKGFCIWRLGMDSDQCLLREGTLRHPGPTSASATTQATKPKSHKDMFILTNLIKCAYFIYIIY